MVLRDALGTTTQLSCSTICRSHRGGQSALELAAAHGHVALEARSHRTGALFGSRELISTALAARRRLSPTERPASRPYCSPTWQRLPETDRAHEALGFCTRAERFVADGDRFRASLACSNEGRALLKLGARRRPLPRQAGRGGQQGLVNRPITPPLSRSAIGHAATARRQPRVSRKLSRR